MDYLTLLSLVEWVPHHLILWLFLGVISFFFARWAAHYSCSNDVLSPITVGTVVSLLIYMWIPPITFLWGMIMLVMFSKTSVALGKIVLISPKKIKEWWNKRQEERRRLWYRD